MGFQHENLETPPHHCFFTVSEGMHYSNASIYKHNEILKHESRDRAHTLVNTKSLLCLCVKFPIIFPVNGLVLITIFTCDYLNEKCHIL